MSDFVPEADGNVVKVDSTAHAQPYMVHKQPPQESGHLTTRHNQKFLQHMLMPSYKGRNQ